MTGLALNALAPSPTIFYRSDIRSSSFRDFFLLKNPNHLIHLWNITCPLPTINGLSLSL